jgi:SAM-dependent methyltransferase
MPYSNEAMSVALDDMKLILDRISNAETVNVDTALRRTVGRFVSHTDTHDIDKFTYVREVMAEGEGKSLLDFGCGRAPHRPYLRHLGFTWTGLDVTDPTDFRGEPRTPEDVIYYDGMKMPFADGAFDVIFASQSFEHVHDPYEAMGEVARCLRPGGAFIGSVSFLEPYHAFQTFCYTPFGFILVAEKSGLEPVKIHPNTDGLWLIFRKLLLITGEAEQDDPLPEFTLENLLGPKAASLPPEALNSLRLQFCGHFSFWFTRPLEEPADPA